VLVDFEPGLGRGLIGIAGMEIELYEMPGRRVDLLTPRDLIPYFREEVVASVLPQYELHERSA
jgi:predicted nucleotidyltransferase